MQTSVTAIEWDGNNGFLSFGKHIVIISSAIIITIIYINGFGRSSILVIIVLSLTAYLCYFILSFYRSIPHIVLDTVNPIITSVLRMCCGTSVLLTVMRAVCWWNTWNKHSTLRSCSVNKIKFKAKMCDRNEIPQATSANSDYIPFYMVFRWLFFHVKFTICLFYP